MPAGGAFVVDAARLECRRRLSAFPPFPVLQPLRIAAAASARKPEAGTVHFADSVALSDVGDALVDGVLNWADVRLHCPVPTSSSTAVKEEEAFEFHALSNDDMLTLHPLVTVLRHAAVSRVMRRLDPPSASTSMDGEPVPSQWPAPHVVQVFFSALGADVALHLPQWPLGCTLQLQTRMARGFNDAASSPTAAVLLDFTGSKPVVLELPLRAAAATSAARPGSAGPAHPAFVVLPGLRQPLATAFGHLQHHEVYPHLANSAGVAGGAHAAVGASVAAAAGSGGALPTTFLEFDGAFASVHTHAAAAGARNSGVGSSGVGVGGPDHNPWVGHGPAHRTLTAVAARRRQVDGTVAADANLLERAAGSKRAAGDAARGQGHAQRPRRKPSLADVRASVTGHTSGPDDADAAETRRRQHAARFVEAATAAVDAALVPRTRVSVVSSLRPAAGAAAAPPEPAATTPNGAAEEASFLELVSGSSTAGAARAILPLFLRETVQRLDALQSDDADEGFAADSTSAMQGVEPPAAAFVETGSTAAAGHRHSTGIRRRGRGGMRYDLPLADELDPQNWAATMRMLGLADEQKVEGDAVDAAFLETGSAAAAPPLRQWYYTEGEWEHENDEYAPSPRIGAAAYAAPRGAEAGSGTGGDRGDATGTRPVAYEHAYPHAFARTSQSLGSAMALVFGAHQRLPPAAPQARPAGAASVREQATDQGAGEPPVLLQVDEAARLHAGSGGMDAAAAAALATSTSEALAAATARIAVGVAADVSAYVRTHIPGLKNILDPIMGTVLKPGVDQVSAHAVAFLTRLLPPPQRRCTRRPFLLRCLFLACRSRR